MEYPKVVAVRVPIHEWHMAKHQWEVRELERKQRWNDNLAMRDSDDSDEEPFVEGVPPNFEATGGSGPPACEVVVQATFFRQPSSGDGNVVCWVNIYDYVPNQSPMEQLMQRIQAARAAAAHSSLLEEEEPESVSRTQPAQQAPANALKPGRGGIGALSLAIPMQLSSQGARSTVCTTQLVDCVSSGGSPAPRASGADVGGGAGGLSQQEAIETGGDISSQMNFGASLGEKLARHYQRGAKVQLAVYCCCGVSEEVAQTFLGDGGMGTMSSASVVVFGKQVYAATKALIDSEIGGL